MFSLQKFGGVTRYFCNLIENLPNYIEYELPVKYSENHYLPEIKEDIKSFSPILSFRVRRRLYYYLNNKLSLNKLHRDEFDIFHPSYYSTYFLKDIKRPFVLTVHDMIHEKFPESFSFYDKTKERKKELIDKAAHIIAVSQCTKNDLVSLLNVNPDKVSVVYHGFASDVVPAKQMFSCYILYVGERKGYKNFDFFLKAINPLLLRNKELKVVCTGMPFTKEELSLFSDLKVEKQLVHISANDSQLASLYKYALVFVYPSVYEGFGIPILEAFRNECPVCLSDASCFPEVAGDAAHYFNPFDQESILNSISNVIDNRSLSDDLRKSGKLRLEKYSIAQMVNSTCEVYHKCL